MAAAARRIEDRDREGQRPDLHQVAVLEPARVGRQGLAVDQGAIAAAQVADDDGLAADGEFGVLTTDLFAVRPKMTGLATADLEVGPDQGNHFPLGLASHDNQLHFHENRPDLCGLQR